MSNKNHMPKISDIRHSPLVKNVVLAFSLDVRNLSLVKNFVFTFPAAPLAYKKTTVIHILFTFKFTQNTAIVYQVFELCNIAMTISLNNYDFKAK